MNWRKPTWMILLTILWAVFINACNVWIFRPLVADYSILGVLALVAIGLVWFLALPPQYRRRWVGFTVFALLLGHGLGAVMVKSTLGRLGIGSVMIIGLVIIGKLFTRWRFRYFALPAVVLLVCNWILPFGEWPYLTHFTVAYRVDLPLSTADLPAPPLEVANINGHNVLVTLADDSTTRTRVEKQASNAVDSADALENLLRNYQHRYVFEEITGNGQQFHLQPLSLTDAAHVNPLAFTTTFFPFIQAQWTVEGGKLVQYMDPANTPRTLAMIAMDAAYLPGSLGAVAASTEAAELDNWGKLLGENDVQPQSGLWQIVHGHLVGSYAGHSMNVPVQATVVVGAGHFTGPGAHELLLEGANLLEVVSLDKQQVVATYSGNLENPVPSDIVIGKVDNSGIDMVFVNSSPARILRVRTTDEWQTLYKAPNDSLRFETTIHWPGDPVPQIITDDPSYFRQSPIRYFTSYRYHNGNLDRNWRVYRTNVVNVHALQFTPSGPPELVIGTYGSGRLFILRPHNVPVVPFAAVLLGLAIATGAGLRWRRRRRKRDEA